MNRKLQIFNNVIILQLLSAEEGQVHSRVLNIDLRY